MEMAVYIHKSILIYLSACSWKTPDVSTDVPLMTSVEKKKTNWILLHSRELFLCYYLTLVCLLPTWSGDHQTSCTPHRHLRDLRCYCSALLRTASGILPCKTSRGKQCVTMWDCPADEWQSFLSWWKDNTTSPRSFSIWKHTSRDITISTGIFPLAHTKCGISLRWMSLRHSKHYYHILFHIPKDFVYWGCLLSWETIVMCLIHIHSECALKRLLYIFLAVFTNRKPQDWPVCKLFSGKLLTWMHDSFGLV